MSKRQYFKTTFKIKHYFSSTAGSNSPCYKNLTINDCQLMNAKYILHYFIYKRYQITSVAWLLQHVSDQMSTIKKC